MSIKVCIQRYSILVSLFMLMVSNGVVSGGIGMYSDQDADDFIARLVEYKKEDERHAAHVQEQMHALEALLNALSHENRGQAFERVRTFAHTLISHGEDAAIFRAADAQGETLLMKAVTVGDIPLIQKLISYNVAVDQRDKKGETALEKAQKKLQAAGSAQEQDMYKQILALLDPPSIFSTIKQFFGFEKKR
jgi:ankyrin repeat protein